MSILFVVTAHTSRLEDAQRLCDEHDATMFLDDGTLGEPGNTRRALQWAEQQNTTHALIIQDDAQPVEGFLELAQQAIDERPNGIISYYLGTGRPKQDEVRALIRQADRNNQHWITMQRIHWGVAWSIPTALLPSLNTFLASHHDATDRATGQWMSVNRHRCNYTWPSLVDHDDGPTLIHTQQPRTARKAWRVKQPSTHQSC
jgi:hypothetical protein